MIFNFSEAWDQAEMDKIGPVARFPSCATAICGRRSETTQHSQPSLYPKTVRLFLQLLSHLAMFLRLENMWWCIVQRSLNLFASYDRETWLAAIGHDYILGKTCLKTGKNFLGHWPPQG